MKFHGNIGVVGNKILPDICVAEIKSYRDIREPWIKIHGNIGLAVIKYLGIVYKISPKYWGAGDKILPEYLEE